MGLTIHGEICRLPQLPPAKTSKPSSPKAIGDNPATEGSVVKGRVVADRERFRHHRCRPQDRRPRGAQGILPARQGRRPSRSGDTVEVYLERIENALGEAVLSRDKARREEAWTRLEQVLHQERARRRRDLRPRQGRLHRRSRRRRGLPARQPGRHPPDPRCRPADECDPALPDSQDGPPPRQYRRVAPRHHGRNPRRTALRTRAESRRRPGGRRRGQEHHRLRRLRRSGRHRRPAACHRHRLEARQPSLRCAALSARR